MSTPKIYSNRKLTKSRLNTRNHGRRNNRIKTVRTDAEGMPDVYSCKLRYVEDNYSFDLGSADTFNVVRLSLNNPYDPYLAVGGKSANYFKQLIDLYHYCRVKKAVITVQFSNLKFVDDTLVQMALVLNQNGYPFSSMDDILSFPVHRRVVSDRFPNIIQDSLELTLSTSIHDALMMTKNQFDNIPRGNVVDVRNFGGPVPPSEEAYLDVYFGRVNTTSSVIACKGTISIVFDCDFYDRIPYPELGQELRLRTAQEIPKPDHVKHDAPICLSEKEMPTLLPDKVYYCLDCKVLHKLD